MKQETIDIMRALLDGETVEESLSSGRWVEIGEPDKVRSAIFEDYREYRIKPRTIRIGKYDVPEPVRMGRIHVGWYLCLKPTMTLDEFKLKEPMEITSYPLQSMRIAKDV